MKFRDLSKKIIIFSIAIAMFFGLNVKSAFAGLWGEDIAAELMHMSWFEMRESFMGSMLATMKNGALMALADQTSAETGSHLITDYNAHLSEEVQGDTSLAMEGYFNTIEDEDSRNGVKPDGFIASARSLTRKAVSGDVYGGSDNDSNIEKYIGGDVRKNLFKESEGGGIDALPMALSDNNNTSGMFLKSLTKATNTKNLIKEAKVTEAIAGNGYKTSGNTAGSTYAEMAASSKTFKNDLIANAETVPELAGILGTTVDQSAMAGFNSNIADLKKNALKQAKDTARSQMRQAWRTTYQTAAKTAVVGTSSAFGPIGTVAGATAVSKY